MWILWCLSCWVSSDPYTALVGTLLRVAGTSQKYIKALSQPSPVALKKKENEILLDTVVQNNYFPTFLVILSKNEKYSKEDKSVHIKGNL